MCFVREEPLRSAEEYARPSPGGRSNWCTDFRWRDYAAIPASRIRRGRSVNARFPRTHADVEPHGAAGRCSGHRRHVARGTYVKEPTRLGETDVVVAADGRNNGKRRRQRAQHHPALIAIKANCTRNRLTRARADGPCYRWLDLLIGLTYRCPL